MQPKLKKFEVENFMGYEYGRIDFDEQNIINIKGYNSSGKSAMIRALNIFFTFAWGTSLTRLVKHDAEYFKLTGTFDDETVVTMRKVKAGAVSYTMEHKGKMLYTTEDKGSAALWSAKEVPEKIAQYFNVLTGTSNLHYRKGRDPLMLVDTTPGQNYKLLSEVLQSDIAIKAMFLARRDLKKYRDDFSTQEAIKTHTMEQLEEVKYLTEEVETALNGLYTQLQQELGLLQQLTDLETLSTNLEVKHKEASIPIFEMPDLSELEALTELEKLAERVDQLTPAADIDYATFIESNSYASQVEEVKALESMLQSMQQLEALEAQEAKQVADKQTLLEELGDLVASGVELYRCDNCGELTTAKEVHVHDIE